jgi:FkbM family methyltransferase
MPRQQQRRWPALHYLKQLLPRKAPMHGQIFDLGNLFRRGDRVANEAAIRSMCMNAYLGDGISLCRALGRYKIFVDTQDIGMATHLMMDGYWEMWTTEAMVGELRPGMTALDIGAHCGYYTMVMGDLVGRGGTVHAFEPNPAMVPMLRRSIDINGFGARTTVHQVALWDTEGELSLQVPEHEPKNAHLAPVTAGVPTVPTRRLDSFPEAMDADFMKIDVEGAEEGLWRGMTGVLERNRPLTIFLEFAAARYADPGAFLDQILAHGFSLSAVHLYDGIVPMTRAGVLGAPAAEDQMLVLRR